MLPLSHTELDRGAVLTGVPALDSRFFVAPELVCKIGGDGEDCCALVRLPASDEATTTSSSPTGMPSGSGRRSLGRAELEKKDVIFWLPESCGRRGAMRTRRTESASAHVEWAVARGEVMEVVLGVGLTRRAPEDRKTAM